MSLQTRMSLLHRRGRTIGIVMGLILSALVAFPPGGAARPPAPEEPDRPRAQSASSTRAGGMHSCLVGTGRRAWCWGSNAYGQIGNGRTGAAPRTPSQVGSWRDWQMIDPGGAHTCGIRAGGALYCWGLNHRGQLGLGDDRARVVPRRVSPGARWLTVSTGWFTTCAVRRDLTAWCWGDNSANQVDASRAQRRTLPTKIPGPGWRSVTAGGWHSCAIRSSGRLWCWGRNSFGQVGNGSFRDMRSPARIGRYSDWRSVSASFTHTCALRRNGQVRCFGRNDRGQLGDGGTRDRSFATAVEGLPAIRQLGVAEGSSCAVSVRFRLWCWGSDLYGALGNGLAPGTRRPARIGSGRYRHVSGGWMHFCAAPLSGLAACWGNNENGQLGNGTLTDRWRPTSPSWRGRQRQDGRSRSSVPSPSVSGLDPAPTPRARRSFSFRIASLNVLGAVHTSPFSRDDHYAPARIRIEWTKDLLRELGDPGILGLQEVTSSQLRHLMRATRYRFAAYPGDDGRGGVQQSLIWKRSVWRADRQLTIRIPFMRWERRQPAVRLVHRRTGRRVWVLNVHNAPGGLQRQRNRALDIELRLIRNLRSTGLPVLFVGDLNEKRTAYCKVVGRTDLYSPAGGWVTPNRCRAPDGMRVDWIFGSRGLAFRRYDMFESPLKRWVNDHRVPVTNVTVP